MTSLSVRPLTELLFGPELAGFRNEYDEQDPSEDSGGRRDPVDPSPRVVNSYVGADDTEDSHKRTLQRELAALV